MNSDRNLRSFPLWPRKVGAQETGMTIESSKARERHTYAILLCEHVVIIVVHNCGTLFF